MQPQRQEYLLRDNKKWRMATMPVGIDQKVEIWKNKLLDLGKRNRLINYRETKRSTLSIKTPPNF